MEEMAVSTRSAGAASHPGQYETHLNVRGDLDVIEKIKKVWASTFNPRSLSARKHAGAPLETDPIGVAVLKMVNARTAGVLFTADPNTGNTSRMIIEANWGLGESVVGGEALPDTYILDKQSLNIIDRKLGTKSRYVAFKEAGVAEMDTPTEKSCAFCLSDEEAEEIGRLGKVLESHFDVPQDAEWAVDQDLDFPENVILLQTRPEVIAQKRTPADQVVDLMLTRLLRR
jgi:pyruvate,water dikinase